MKLAFVADISNEAQNCLATLLKSYDSVEKEEADVIVALGGDGFMLETLHQSMTSNIPVYGLNCGTVGFLMNKFKPEKLIERLNDADVVELHPLEMDAETIEGHHVKARAINEVSLTRQSRQASKIGIEVDGVVRMQELVCDGVLVATSAGSTAYNLSAHGPIIPIGTDLLALTPISAFRPRRWRGALLPHTSKICFDIKEHTKRPVSAVADFTEVKNVKRVEIRESRDITLRLLFDKNENLKERIIQEQFII